MKMKGKHTNTVKKELIDKIQSKVKGKLNRRQYHELAVWQLEMAILQIRLHSLVGHQEAILGPFSSN